MNPYALLKRLGNWQALDATLVSADGETRYNFKVKPEEIADHTIEGQYASVVRIRVWSTSDCAVDPTDGDSLEVANADGSVSRYVITRNPASTRFSDWRFLKNGTRKIFYTRY